MKKVLVVEDNSDQRECLRELLVAAGYQPVLTGSAEEALAVLLEASSRFSAVLTDGELPGQNGLWLAEQIQDQRGTLFLVLLTGNGGLLQKGAARGLFDLVLGKPVRFSDLKEELKEGLSRTATQSNRASRRKDRDG